jgi:rRNA maturation endonuclease Nob1
MHPNRKLPVLVALGVSLVLAAPAAWADRWDVRREIAEGNREIRQERREAVREIMTADSAWEARREVREAGREIRHEQREARREVRREVAQASWGY